MFYNLIKDGDKLERTTIAYPAAAEECVVFQTPTLGSRIVV